MAHHYTASRETGIRICSELAALDRKVWLSCDNNQYYLEYNEYFSPEKVFDLHKKHFTEDEPITISTLHRLYDLKYIDSVECALAKLELEKINNA